MRRKRSTAAIVLFFFLMAAGGCGRKPQGPAEIPRVPVEVAPVRRGDIVQTARVTGTVQPGTTVQVMAPLSGGRLEAVLVQMGDRVSQGQVIAELENSDLEVRLAQARAGLEQARTAPEQAAARLQQAEAQARLDAANLERTETLFAQGAASRQQLDMARAAAEASQGELAAARAALASAQAGVAAAEAAVRQAEVALENTYIKAPVAGAVAARHLEPGEVAQGPVVTLVTSDDLQVEIGVAEQDVNYLRPGKEVRVEIAAAAGETLAGKVASVSPAADEHTRVFQVKIALVKPPAEVKPGMAATVIYTTRQASNALLVPKNAVINRSGQSVVYIVVEGKATGRVVATGIDDGRNIEIVKGLSGDERIIVKGQDFVNEGQPVEVVEGGAAS